jgi:UTP--glucose-1-phosphate uridylyltransferase
MKITKAVITCAGFGTRFLPISKTIQKEMLPILNRPTIDYVVEDCIRAGITDIIIVMNAHNYQPLHYYRENLRLKKYLKKTGKAELYQEIQQIPHKANFHFVKQTDQDPYGTSIPVKLAKKHVENEEAFLYLTGDDFVYTEDKNRCLIAELIDLFQRSEARAAITCLKIPMEEIHRYGVAEVKHENGFDYLETFIEKPAKGQTRSNLANVSKYVLTPEIFALIERQQPNPQNNEYYITDLILEMSHNSKVVVKNANSHFLNSGEPLTWLKANLMVAGQDEEMKTELKKFIAKNW